MDLNKANKDLLIIFTRNIELGKCKTRLAKSLGAQSALDIYSFLVGHTAAISRDITASKWVFYSENPEQNDYFDDSIFEKFSQTGNDLGIRMHNAISAGFDQGYNRIVIIGSDIYDLGSEDLVAAFNALDNHDYVIGPARDGGYYLLGMKERNPSLFQNKAWGTDSVLRDTLQDLADKGIEKLSVRNDIDVYEDLIDVPEFERFLSTD